MRIATFNINGIRRRLPALLQWLAETAPDVVCLQEIRVAHDLFPAAEIRDAGYGAIWRGQRPQYNGVAILTKDAEPLEVRHRLPGDAADVQSRYIEAAVDGVLIASLYAPNGNPQPGPKFDYKLAWLERLVTYAAELSRTDLPIVLAGDFNVVPTDLDIYPTKSWDDDALLQPQARSAFRRLIEQGWTDAIRVRYPTESIYTFWDYMRNRWPRDAGLRIDHVLLSKAVTGRLIDAGVDREVRGREGASDHAPVWIELR